MKLGVAGCVPQSSDASIDEPLQRCDILSECLGGRVIRGSLTVEASLPVDKAAGGRSYGLHKDLDLLLHDGLDSLTLFY